MRVCSDCWRNIGESHQIIQAPVLQSLRVQSPGIGMMVLGTYLAFEYLVPWGVFTVLPGALFAHNLVVLPPLIEALTS